MTSEHNFCRKALALILDDVREAGVSETHIKNAWGHKTCGTHEFHGPDDFYWVNQSCCIWHAKAQGWMAYLREKERKEATP